jgi:hypothetical protein
VAFHNYDPDEYPQERLPVNPPRRTELRLFPELSLFLDGFGAVVAWLRFSFAPTFGRGSFIIRPGMVGGGTRKSG